MALSPRGIKVKTIYPRPRKIKRRHPVFYGTSPHFYYLIKGKKEDIPSKNTPEPVNKNLLKVAKKIKKPFVKTMEKNMRSVRNFLTGVLGPTMLPLISSIEEARDILQEITGEEVKSSMYSILMRHANHAAEVKVASFIAEYLELNEQERERFLERLHLEKQSTYDLLKMQKMDQVRRSREGNSGLQLPQVSSVQRRNKGRSA